MTKTKTITIGGGPKRKRRKSTDVVGIDMYGGDDRGFPAVRIACKKGRVKILAAGFVPPPEADLPVSWEDASKNPGWSLPSAFQAPHAAFALSSPEMFVTQTTLDAVKSDIANGAHIGDSPSSGEPKVRKLGIRREPKAEDKKPAGGQGEIVKVDDSAISPGVPVSNGGTRFVMRQTAFADDFVIEAGIPEFQALWLSRLLPEGKRPTVASIQPKSTARVASILKDPEFLKAGGTGLALIIGEKEITIAGFKDGDLVLWRKSKSVYGGMAIREAVRKNMGVEDDMLESIIDEGLVDPRPAIESVIMPLLDELAISRDYLAGKLGIEIKTAFLVGVRLGSEQWSAIADERAHLKFIPCRAFDGLDGVAPDPAEAHRFTAALGAALALMAEDDE